MPGKPPECQAVWIQIRSELLSGLIWVQAVSNSYQRTTLVGKRKFENEWKNTGWSVKQTFGFRSGGVHVWLCVRGGGGGGEEGGRQGLTQTKYAK